MFWVQTSASKLGTPHGSTSRARFPKKGGFGQDASERPKRNSDLNEARVEGNPVVMVLCMRPHETAGAVRALTSFPIGIGTAGNPLQQPSRRDSPVHWAL